MARSIDHHPPTNSRALAALASFALAGALVAIQSSIALSQTRDSTRTDSTRSQLLETVKVTGRIDDIIGVATTASEGRVGAADLRLRPIMREGEVLETVPGLIVTQHSGEGKANQYFVRGFNLDHGTDFATTLDGMPVNMPTHGHGQGYTDLNFLIPELIDHVDYKLGVYHAELGDFGSAGGAELHLVSALDHPFASLTGGQNGLGRLAAAGSTRLGGGILLAAGEVKSYDGPWDRREQLRKVSGVGRYSWERGSSRFSVTGMAYHNRWNANDQIPDRAVEAGVISRFGQIDSTDGGGSERYSLSGAWQRTGSRGVDAIELYGIYSDLSLFSDFTYFLDDPVRGDQFNQTDRRTVIGGSASHTQSVDALARTHLLKVGVQSRADIINGLGLYRTARRERFATVREDRVRQTGTGVFVEIETPWTRRLRSVLGARADAYTFGVSSDIAENSGSRAAAIASPKASLAYMLSPRAELYASAGYGFHSNDARGTTIAVDPATGDPAQRVDPLVRSRGAELGARLSLADGFRTTLTAWTLALDSELLFTGDAGTTEASAESHRRGITLANFYRPVSWLSLDADIALARARFVGVQPGENHIPGALESVVASGATWIPTSSGLSGSVRLRRFAAYPLIEDNSVRASPSTLISAEAGYRIGADTRVQIAVLNALNNRAADIQYFYPSRLRSEPVGGVDGVHSHPVEPRQVRIALEHAFR